MAYLTNTTRPVFMGGSLNTRNPPSPQDGVAQTAQKQPGFWALTGTDAVSDVRATGYITDAKNLGMQVGDILWYVKRDASPITVQVMIVTAINATTGAGDLSDGTAIDATNT